MEGTMKFSLTFSKTREQKFLQSSALANVPESKKQTIEVIESIEDNVIKSNLPEEAELIIPLPEDDRASSFKARAIQKAKQKAGSHAADGDANGASKPIDRELTLDEQARNALLAEAAGIIDGASKKEATAITQSSLVSGLRSADPSAAGKPGKLSSITDYEKIEVEGFGSAMLRGMGWKKDQGVGNIKNRQVVSIIEASNKTLGNVSTKPAGSSDSSQQQDGCEQLPLVKGSYVKLHSGRHSGTYGLVECVEEDHLLVRRAVGGPGGVAAVLREVEANVTVVTKEEYKGFARVINKEMYDKYKTSESQKKKHRSKRQRSDSEEQNELDEEHKTGEGRLSIQQDSSKINEKQLVKQEIEHNEKKTPPSTGEGTVQKMELLKQEESSISDDSDGKIYLPKFSDDGHSRIVKDEDKTNRKDVHNREIVKSDRRRKEDNDIQRNDNIAEDALRQDEYNERDHSKHKNSRYGKQDYSERESSNLDSSSNQYSDSRHRTKDDNYRCDNKKSRREDYSSEYESRREKVKYDSNERTNKEKSRNKDKYSGMDDDQTSAGNNGQHSSSRRDSSHQTNYSRKSNSCHYTDHRAIKNHDNSLNSKGMAESANSNERRACKTEDQEPTSSAGSKASRAAALLSRYGDCSATAQSAPWVREGLTVRIISQKFKKGKYYKEKVRVESMLTATSCSCRTDQGKLLQDVPPSILETVIPKTDPRIVMLLRGAHSTQVARVLEQHKKEQKASVQLLEDRSVIVRLPYEDICQYRR